LERQKGFVKSADGMGPKVGTTLLETFLETFQIIGGVLLAGRHCAVPFRHDDLLLAMVLHVANGGSLAICNHSWRWIWLERWDL
jgi:hypothetical protein